MTEKKHLAPSVLDELRRDLERLKLKAMLAFLDEALETAQQLEQGYVAFLANLVQRELITQNEARANRRIKAATFPALKTFDSFDWGFQPGLNVQLAKDLMNLHFIRQARPLLLFGRPGTGKTHLSLGYGHLAALKGYSVRYFSATRLLQDLYACMADSSVDRFIARLSRADLLIIDDLRDVPPRPEYASLLFELVEARHNKHALILSSNISVGAWGTALGNPTLAAALVDRLMERAHILNIKRGRSYRSEGPEAPPVMERPTAMLPASSDASDEN